MRLVRQQLQQTSKSIVQELVAADAIEVADAREVEIDIQSVLVNYADEEAAVTERARELLSQRNLPEHQFARIKKLTAEQRGIQVGDDALDYLLDQIIQMLMRSGNVEEVFAADHELRRIIRPFILKADASEADSVDAEVRAKLKHVEEGSRLWEIEYQRVKADILRRRGA
jgi:hypothetical protein